ncbi:MAG: hypothetical protein QOJ16_2554, partial [Acidobacteriota bacterium]|nr:hypothetical protein [Acidobacteriota bacterium]
NRAIAEPGGVFAVVLRTYAARPIRQGQVSIRVAKPVTKAARSRRVSSGASTPPPPPTSPPIATLLSAVIFSVNGDAQSRTSAAVDATGSNASLQFQSPSAGINAADGPLAVFFFQLDPGVAPGQKLNLEIDPKVTSLLDADGRQVVLDPRPGILEVRAPGAPRTLGTDGGTATAGGLATIAAQTFEPFAVSGGQIALRFDPDLLVGDPVVRMDPRYGQAVFTVDRGTPGLLVVSFTSPGASYNTIPGSIVAVDLTVAAGAAAGTVSPIEIDPLASWLLDAQGQKIDFILETGTLTIH